ncbi:MAG: Holliday junction resolvase RuvX [bacterium]
MRLIGVDYGTKKIGLALSDESGSIANPWEVISTKMAIETITKICQDEHVGLIVLGESVDTKGEDNLIMTEIRSFAAKLSAQTKLEVKLEPEYFSSLQVAKMFGRDKTIDARAAAIILQSYIDKSKNNI